MSDSRKASAACCAYVLAFPFLLELQRGRCGSVILVGMPYDDERDVLIRRDEADSALWRVMSRVAVRSPPHPWPVALEHARAHAKRTGGGVYRQVGNGTPEQIEPHAQ